MTFIYTGSSGTIGRHIQDGIPITKNLLDIDYHDMRGSSRFLHLAGIVGEKAVTKDLALARAINLDQTIRLGKLAIENGYETFIFVSSSHVYKLSKSRLSETSPLEASSHYSELKIAAEIALQDLFEGSATKLLILRLFSVLGSGMVNESLGGLLDRIQNGSKEKITNSNDIRDFMTPKEYGNLLQNIACQRLESSCIVNVCTGIGKTVEAASREYLKKQNFSCFEEVFLGGNSHMPYIVGDNSKFNKLFLVNFNRQSRNED